MIPTRPTLGKGLAALLGEVNIPHAQQTPQSINVTSIQAGREVLYLALLDSKGASKSLWQIMPIMTLKIILEIEPIHSIFNIPILKIPTASKAKIKIMWLK